MTAVRGPAFRRPPWLEGIPSTAGPGVGKTAVMPRTHWLGPRDLRLMQGLARRVTTLRAELVNSGATVGEVA